MTVRGLSKYLPKVLRLDRTGDKDSWTRASLTQRRGPEETEKRVLLIWDFRAQPYSIGDLLVLQEVGLVLRLMHNVEKIDLCMVYDPLKPTYAPEQPEITSENFHTYLGALFPVAFLNPHLGSFMVMDSHRHLEEYISDNIDRYFVWPSQSTYQELAYPYYEAYKLILSFHEQHGYVPTLSCRPVTLTWAASFLKERASPSVPIVVHLRRNAKVDEARNATIDAWLALFEYCENKHPVKFIVIGTAREIDERLRRHSNVLFAKDFDTNVEQDLALVQSSAIFMGNASGPCTMAVFGTRPYIILNVALRQQPGIASDGSFVFAADHQRLIWEPETAGLLIAEFETMFRQVKLNQWQPHEPVAYDSAKTSVYLA